MNLAGAVGPSRSTLAARLVVLAAALAAALVGAVRLGATPLSTGAVLDAIAGRGDATAVTIVRELRLPRAVQAALVGAALAASGATFQALLRNPLADPYVLGVSSGAAAGAVVAVVTGLAARSAWALPAAAFAGAAGAMLAVLRIAAGVGRALDTRVLLLAGVVVSSFLVAAIWLALSFADVESVRSAIFWMMGSHAGATWRSVATLGVCLVPSLAALLALARPLNLLAVGDATAAHLGTRVERTKLLAFAVATLLALARPLNLLAVGEATAAHLGTRVERTKLLAFAVATLLAAASVAVSGTIGFVGLVVPHAVRLVWGSDNRALLPAAALAGATFLVLADTVARTAAGATELPVGVVTAFVGVPFFVWLLRRPGVV